MEPATPQDSNTGQETRATRRTRFVCISDTHNANIALPKGDVLIHAGDLTNKGSYSELSKAVQWLEKANFECKIVIAGNHELTLDEPYYTGLKASSSSYDEDVGACRDILKTSSLTYLCHDSAEIRLTSPSGPHTRFTVFGSPYSPRRGEETAFSAFVYDSPTNSSGQAPTLWADIAPGTDIVVTHTPPRGHVDVIPSSGARIGCPALLSALWRVRPRLAVCGHVHMARGAEHVTWGPVEDEVASVERWIDPAPEGNKNSLIDLREPRGALKSGSGRGGGDGQGQREQGEQGSGGYGTTCVVNASIKTESYWLERQSRGHRKANKPIVVDLDLPVWEA